MNNYYTVFDIKNSTLSIALKDPNFDPNDDEPDQAHPETNGNHLGLFVGIIFVAFVAMVVTGVICRKKKTRSLTFATGLLQDKNRDYAEQRQKEIQQYV